MRGMSSRADNRAAHRPATVDAAPHSFSGRRGSAYRQPSNHNHTMRRNMLCHNHCAQPGQQQLPFGAASRSNDRMELMLPTDSMFLFAESRERPLHVGGLSLFEPPKGAGRKFVRRFYKGLVANNEFQPTFRRRPATIGGGIAQLAWAYDDEVDTDYHVRRSALPSPGRVRDLLELTRGCTRACSTGTARCGNCMSSRGSKTAGSRSIPRCTTPSSTVSRR